MEIAAHYQSPSPSLLLPPQPQIRRRFSLSPTHYSRSDLKLSPALFTPMPSPLVRTTANAVGDVFTIAAVSPAKGDISVLLQTSAVLLGMYWVANFLVPSLISNYFGFGKNSEEDNQNKPEEGNSTTKEGRSSSQTKDRSFNSTKV